MSYQSWVSWAASSASSASVPMVYEVEYGETLFGICERFQVRMEDVQELNQLEDSRLTVGTAIKLRAPKSPANMASASSSAAAAAGRSASSYLSDSLFSMTISSMLGYEASSPSQSKGSSPGSDASDAASTRGCGSDFSASGMGDKTHGLLPELIGLPAEISPQRPCILSPARAALLQASLPAYLQLQPWRLLYSLYDHGSDISQFYSHCRGRRCSVLLVQTTAGDTFGGLASHEWHISQAYYGSGSCALFKFVSASASGQEGGSARRWATGPDGQLRKECVSLATRAGDEVGAGAGATPDACADTDTDADAPIVGAERQHHQHHQHQHQQENLEIYPWSGENEYFQWSSADQVAMGGGGSGFGFVLDSDFRAGSTAASATFQNRPLVAVSETAQSTTTSCSDCSSSCSGSGSDSGSSPSTSTATSATTTSTSSGSGSTVTAREIHQFDIVNVEVWSFDAAINRSKVKGGVRFH